MLRLGQRTNSFHRRNLRGTFSVSLLRGTALRSHFSRPGFSHVSGIIIGVNMVMNIMMPLRV